jgi:O-methyltransferase involved in polyketide biosynthesis
MTERDARIAPTAHYTAHVWHRLGLPHAELFATERGRRLFWSFRLAGEWIAAATPGMPSMVDYLELRHGAIEHALEQLAPDIIIELGAGLSRRGATWAADRGVDYVEVDLAHMIAAKRRALERAPPELRHRIEGKLRHAAIDVLSDQFGDFLTRELAQRERPVVVAEGLLGYFALPERGRLVSSIAQALRARGGGALICDLRAGEGGPAIAAAAKILRGAIWLVTRGRGAREDFSGPEAARSFLLEAGFARAEQVPPEQATPELARLRSPARVWRADV